MVVQARKYVDHKASTAMLAVKRSAGVAPEVNLRNPIHAGKKHTSKGTTQALKPRADVTRSGWCKDKGKLDIVLCSTLLVLMFPLFESCEHCVGNKRRNRVKLLSKISDF